MTRVAVFGTGSIGLRHLSVFSALGVESIAVPTRPERLGAAELAPFGRADSLAGAREMGATHAVLATNTGRHLADLELALELGFDVLVEKPLAPTLVGCRAMFDLAASRGRSVAVGFCLRFHPTLVAARELLHRVGRPWDVRVECQSYLPSWRPGSDHRTSYSASADEGGVLRDLSHEVDYAAWLFGTPSTVFGHCRNSGSLGIAGDDQCHIGFSADRDAFVSIHLDYLARAPRRGFRVTGDRGTLEVDLLGGRIAFRDASGDVTTVEASTSRDEMMQRQALAFLDRGSAAAKVAASLEDAMNVVAICDATREAAKVGRMTAVENWRSE